VSESENPRDIAKLLAILQLKLACNEATKYLNASAQTPAYVLTPREVIALTRTVLQGAAFLAWEAPQVAGTADPVQAGKWLEHATDEELLALQRIRERARLAT
jgi:hypothetical protein